MPKRELYYLPAIVDYSGHCYYCNPERFKSVRLAKQKKVSDFLSTHFNIESIDTIIENDCGDKQRPDIVINPLSRLFKIIIEVDEGQHKYIPEQTLRRRWL